ncbi:unnamed protein product [Vicia faba]|uniref:Uncharacterized protein n=1 Tax=Vicia faba TaxID=3906 RepID=A0AAV0ZAJ0_VICFA|nr:unnamed protein product [Vicia faba]
MAEFRILRHKLPRNLLLHRSSLHNLRLRLQYIFHFRFYSSFRFRFRSGFSGNFGRSGFLGFGLSGEVSNSVRILSDKSLTWGKSLEQVKGTVRMVSLGMVWRRGKRREYHALEREKRKYCHFAEVAEDVGVALQALWTDSGMAVISGFWQQQKHRSSSILDNDKAVGPGFLVDRWCRLVGLIWCRFTAMGNRTPFRISWLFVGSKIALAWNDFWSVLLGALLMFSS